jgi:site-specific DNA recombinase
MLHTFVTKKNGRQYRYYVPYLHKRRNAGASLSPNAHDVGHLPAAEIEGAVLGQIRTALSAPQMLIAVWQACQRHGTGAALEEAHVVVAMQRLGEVWSQLFPAEQQRIARLLIERVQLHTQGMDILWREDGWVGLGPDIHAHPLVEESQERWPLGAGAGAGVSEDVRQQVTA